MITAQLNNYRQSSRKVRLLADLIRGKKITDALVSLEYAGKRASLPFMKLLKSAVANAKHNFDMKEETLFVKAVEVNQGDTLMRRMPRARGSAFPIRKRTSHVVITLDQKEIKEKTKKSSTKKVATKNVTTK